MSTYSLVEYSENYSRIYGSLWQYCRDEQTLCKIVNIIDFTNTNTTDFINLNLGESEGIFTLSVGFSLITQKQ